jgi:hypothetical protein
VVFWRSEDVPENFTQQQTNQSSVIVNWDGEQVDRSEKWVDRELFSLGGVSVTTKDALISSGVLVAIIAVSSAVCLYLSWRNRKHIAEGARRASVFARKSMRRLRRTLVGRGAEEGGQDWFEGNKN